MQGLWSQKNLPRPNIIIFLVDDMGWQDCSLPFANEKTALNKKYHTPNMEKMAKDGMMFTNAYASPVCTPSRVSLMTGMNPAHHGVTNWTSPNISTPTDVKDSQFVIANWNYNGLSPIPGIPKTCYATTLPQILKDAGYFTLHVGKAHWGSAGTPGANPYNIGFVVNIAGHAAGHPQSYLGTENYGNLPGKTSMQAVPDLEAYYGTDTFLTEALTLEAIKALEYPIKNKQPFFLHFAQYAIHTPLQADKRFVQKYLNAGLSPTEANYASLIEGMDKSLGDLINFLDEKGVSKNTLILFLSDNGGLSLAKDIGGPRDGISHTQNLPLRAGKGSVYEGGIRIPMIVKCPSLVNPESKTDTPVIIEDVFPTILEIAGIKKYKTVQKPDGISFLPVLRNENHITKDRIFVWHYPNKWIPNDGPGINYFSAARQGDWKIVYNMRNGNCELYNLKTDIGEQENLSTKYPERTKTILELLKQKLKNWEAPTAKLRSDIEPNL